MRDRDALLAGGWTLLWTGNGREAWRNAPGNWGAHAYVQLTLEGRSIRDLFVQGPAGAAILADGVKYFAPERRSDDKGFGAPLKVRRFNAINGELRE